MFQTAETQRRLPGPHGGTADDLPRLRVAVQHVVQPVFVEVAYNPAAEMAEVH